MCAWASVRNLLFLFSQTDHRVWNANNRKGKPIMPESKESMVSMARNVFPVFVGPRTAVILFCDISINGTYNFSYTTYCYS